MPLFPSTSFGCYEILSTLGAGGMGEVYLAHDARLNRRVALKMLSADLTDNRERLHRLEQEAQAASALNHPNIITIYEIGAEDETHFIAMEFIEGETLRRKLQTARLEIAETLNIATQIAAALDAAHRSGIVHRDLKPENVMLREDGFVKVLDFGLAKLTNTKGDMPVDTEIPTRPLMRTTPGMVMGTVVYMSPEQVRGQEVDARTDIFSFGVVLYEMLTGRLPFADETMNDCIASILKSEPAPLDANTPPELQGIVRKALQKKADARYQSAKDLLVDLKSLQKRLEFESELECASPARDDNFRKLNYDNLRSDPRFEDLRRRVFPAQNFERETLSEKQSENAKKQNFVQTEPIEKHRTEKQVIKTAESETRAAAPFKLKINKRIGLLAAACLVLILFGAFFLWQKWRTDARFEKIELRALTTSGNIGDSAISPDGKLFAYAKNENGKKSIWIRQMQLRASEMRLTEPIPEASFVGMSFTPDGNKIYFLFGSKNNSIKQLYAISILGGKPTAILDDVDSPPAFSPEGKRFAFMRGNSKTGVATLFIADADGSALRELTERAPPLSFRLRPLAWSPDGKKIVCVVFDRTLLSSLRIVEIDAETGAETAVNNQLWSEIEAIAWTKDGAGLLFTASEPEKPLYSQIWFLPYPNGTPRRLTNDLVNYGNLSVARDSGEIIVRQQQTENQVWLIDAKSPTAAPRRITPNNSDGEHGLVWTPDNHLIYSSVINGSNSLQKMSIQDLSQVSLTSGEYVFSQPCATSDGRYIVYVSMQAQHYYLWRVNADGKDTKQLTGGNIGSPSCSPDGRRIFYSAVTDGKRSVREISIDGGEPRLVSEKIVFSPKISPDGARIACFYRAEAKAAWQIAILRTDKDRVLQTFDLLKTVALSLPFVWTKEGDGLILIETREGVANLWRYPLDGQTPTQITNFADTSLPIINNFAVSSDGSQIALTRARTISDIVQIVGESPPTAR